MIPSPTSIYSHPAYWDLLFRDETRREAEFFEAAFRRYVPFAVRQLLEPGCGSGRLVVEMARRGYRVLGFDRNRQALEYLRSKLRRRRLAAHVQVFEADLAEFRLDQPVDAAFCTFNTFRHLLDEASARRHLESVAKAVQPGGIYILGLHLLPADVSEHSEERWQARHGRLSLHATLRVVAFDRRKRQERLRLVVRVGTPRRTIRLVDVWPMRIYTPSQMRRLLARVPAWELVDVFDFWYEMDRPRGLDEEMVDTVLILRRR
ncbi:MAG: class I SAM-dependent methyltransferase [Gemmatales bacterium]|nr:class I SAM-dependent methyltransferase [Gemmatales bacterium]MDW8388112.1 class I SAM-dependent methyltransferase [Gemmatales bacterium]